MARADLPARAADRYGSVANARNGALVAGRVEIADTILRRAIGLIGRSELRPGEGIWLEPCNGVHTAFMSFPIDAVFLSGDGVVLRVARSVRPWRIAGPVKGARAVLEVPAGATDLADVRVGDRLTRRNSSAAPGVSEVRTPGRR